MIVFPGRAADQCQHGEIIAVAGDRFRERMREIIARRRGAILLTRVGTHPVAQARVRHHCVNQLIGDIAGFGGGAFAQHEFAQHLTGVGDELFAQQEIAGQRFEERTGAPGDLALGGADQVGTDRERGFRERLRGGLGVFRIVHGGLRSSIDRMRSAKRGHDEENGVVLTP